jgi:hypothetical protein
LWATSKAAFRFSSEIARVSSDSSVSSQSIKGMGTLR